MPDMSDITKLLDELLPDEKVQADIARIIWEENEENEEKGKVEINEQWITIPVGCELAVTTKAFFKEYYAIPFGPFMVQVAIGGVEKIEHGIQYAKYCFTTIYYTENFQVLTIDFYADMR